MEWWDAYRARTARYYQEDAVETVLRDLLLHPSVLVAMATGLGKSFIFSEIARRYDGRVLVLAHRDELVKQGQAELESATGEFVDVEQAKSRASIRSRIVFATPQTLARRKSRFPVGHFDLLLVDEAHHYAAKSWLSVLEYFSAARRIGFTATPDRGDKKSLARVFPHTSYSMGIADGIEAGFLVDVSGHRIVLDEIKLDEVPVKNGDLDAVKLDEAMLSAVEGLVAKTLELEPGRQGIVFMPGVSSAEFCAHRFNVRVPGSARFASHMSSDRADVVRDYRAGKFRYLVNCALFIEGFDAPETSLIVQGTPTLSRPRYAQMVGRGTRVLPGLVDESAGRDQASRRRELIAGSAKPDMVILDFVGNSRHSLVTPEDIVGEDYTPAERAVARKKRAPGGNVRDELAKAREWLKSQASRITVAKVQARVSVYNPFTTCGLNVSEEDKHKYKTPATEGQLVALQRLGVPDEQLTGLSRSLARRLLKGITERRKNGLATYKQLVTLKRHGWTNPMITFDAAKRGLDYLAKNRWSRRIGADDLRQQMME